MARVHYTDCPVCASKQINPLLTVKDFSVSGEEFVLWQCTDCELRFTQDVPDEGDIAPYYKFEDYISHTDTSKGFINKTYKRVRNYTLEKKANIIEQQTGVQKGKLLDVGSGTGSFLHAMQSRGWEVNGIEPDGDARAKAKQLYDIDTLQPASIHQLPEGSFDAITLWHVLEHVHQLQPYVQQLKKLLKPTGKLVVAVPNYQSLDARIYSVHWAAYDVPRHLYHFAPKAIEVLMQRNGLRVANKMPMWFDSFYIALLSSKYKQGKTGYISSFLNGLRSNLSAAFNKDRCSSIIYIIEKTGK